MSRQSEARAFATYAPAFEAPRLVEIAAGCTIAQIVAGLYADGLAAPALDGLLVVFVDDALIDRVDWDRVTPIEGQVVSIRVRPGAPGIIASIASFAFKVLVNYAVSAAISAVVKAFTPSPEADHSPDVYDIAGASNEVARYRPVPVVLGKFRSFPPHAAKAYTEVAGEKTYLRALLCWGVGPLALDESTMKIGDTPLASFAGVEMQHRLKPSDPWPSLFPSSADEDEGPGLLEYATGWIARATTASDAQELQVELLFPNGLIYHHGDGKLGAYDVDVRIRYKRDGATAWLDFVTGAPMPEDAPVGGSSSGGSYSQGAPGRYVISAKTSKPYRFVATRKVDAGRYIVAVKRDQVDDPGPKGVNAFHWSKLRTFTFAKAVTDDNLAVTALKIEAGDQLTGVVDQINGVVTRLAPAWSAESASWGAAGQTQKPAELARWIATGPGAARPRGSDEIDDAAFGAWAELCAARDWRCDMELRAGASHDEVLTAVAKCGRAILAERGGKLTPIIDDTQAAATQLFTPRNSWGFRVQGRYPDACHALRVEFANEDKDYVKDEMLVFFPGYAESTAELIETVQSVGKTRPTEIYREGRRAIAERVLRREEFAWSADLENLACARGQRVAVAHFVMGVGVKAARVKAVIVNDAGTHAAALLLDEEFDQTPGESYGIKWRKVASGAISVENLALINGGAKTTTASLAAAVPVANAPQEGDLVEIGLGGEEVVDLVVQNITRSGAFEAELTGLRYLEGLWSDDAAALPAWSSNVTGVAFPRPPKPVILQVSARAGGIDVAFDLPQTSERVDEIALAWRESPEDDEEIAWDALPSAPPSARLVSFPPPLIGKFYDLRLTLVRSGAGGARSLPAYAYEASLDAPADVPEFTAYPSDTRVLFMWKRAAWKAPLEYEIRAGVTWDDGTYIPIGEGDGETATIERPMAANERFWIKARSVIGLVYSKNACAAAIFQAPQPPAFFVGSQNGDVIRFSWSSFDDLTLRFEIRSGLTWDLGRQVDVVMGYSTTVQWPIANDNDAIFWIKTLHPSGVVSKDATVWVATIATSSGRNVILIDDLGGDNFLGVLHAMTRDEIDGAPALLIDSAGGYSAARADYYDETALIDSFYARAWIEQRANAIISDSPTWDETDLTWDDAGETAWDATIGDPGAARLESFIAPNLDLPPHHFIDGCRFNGSLTGINGMTPSASTGVSYAPARAANGVTLSDSGVLRYDVPFEAEWSMLFDVRLGAEPETDRPVATLSNEDGAWLQLYWRAEDRVYVLAGHFAPPIAASVPWIEDDTISVAIWQTAEARGLVMASRLNTTPVSGAALLI